MIIAHNMMANNAQGQLNISTKKKNKNMERLSSGYRINRSADDAAGLTISEKMRWQVKGLNRASKNIQDGISLIQTAEGALNESHSILHRMNELATQAANDTNTKEDRVAIQNELDQLSDELDHIAQNTTFNGSIKPLLGGEIKYPDNLAERPVTVVNNSAYNITCDGTTYNPGQSFVISNVLSILKPDDLSQMSHCAVWAQYNSAGTGAGYCTTDTFTIGAGAPCDATITYSTWDDLKIDENGFFYTEMLGTLSGYRMYLQSNRFNQTNDFSKEKLEQDGCLKAEIDGKTKLELQVGATEGQGVEVNLVNATAKNLGISNIDVSSHVASGKSMTKIQKAIEKVSEFRSDFGATQNRLEHAMLVDDNTAENTQSAESKLRDANMAKEMMEFSKHNILEQAGTAVLSQANQTNQGVVNLLQ